MKRIIFLGIVVLISYTTIAQNGIRKIQSQSEKILPEDTTHLSGWKSGGVFSLGIGQGASSNWAAGAETFSFSIGSYGSLFANLKSGKLSWDNTLDMGYALVKTSSQGARKTDDKIDLYSKLARDLSNKLSIGGVANFRTQFTKGFDYNYLGKGLKRATSSFMAPAYLILAPGIDWHPKDYFSIFLSPVAGRFVIVSTDTKRYYYNDGLIPDSIRTPATGNFEVPLAILYGVDPNTKVRSELGGFASVNFFKEIFKNVAFKTRLDLYSNYLQTDQFEVTGPDEFVVTKVDARPDKVDVFWTNLIVMKINKYLNVNYSIDLIYDDDVRQFGTYNRSAATQFRSQLTIGFSASF